MLTVDENVKCSAIVDHGGEDGIGPCGKPSRFVVERSDQDESYGVNGGSEESCEEHLAEAVTGMINGDAEITAIVTPRWDM
jgi:hypothetical protein